MSGYHMITKVKDSAPTKEQFDGLLTWLDADRERAGDKYEAIREKLIEIISWRGGIDAEDLADETINRVASKVKELKNNYAGDPALYFYGVAKKVMIEQRRFEQRQADIKSIADSIHPLYSYDEKTEGMLEVLDECLSVMTEDERALIISYYQGEKQSKIDHRKDLAQELQLSAFALRKRVQRLRIQLEKCVRERLEGFAEAKSDHSS